jgi:hypothetical protein
MHQNRIATWEAALTDARRQSSNLEQCGGR